MKPLILQYSSVSYRFLLRSLKSILEPTVCDVHPVESKTIVNHQYRATNKITVWCILVLSFLITHGKTKDAELNIGKHSRKVICPYFHREYKFDFLLSFSVYFNFGTFSSNLWCF